MTEDTVPRQEPFIELRGIVKQFGGLRALDGADLVAHRGQVTALVGDNGAGKSTLVKVGNGVYTPDEGEIVIRGVPARLDSPAAAQRMGIETVYQDLALAPDLPPAANMFLGREHVRQGLLGRLGFLDEARMRRETEERLRDLRINLRGSGEPVAQLSGGQRQMVAITRAMAFSERCVFLDEPTAALGVVQTRSVLDLIKRVRDLGTAVVLISHNMHDVMAVADQVTVLRLGRTVATLDPRSCSVDDIVSAITGAASYEAPPGSISTEAS